ncbi:unnamed protein product [Menidia menidia]|uniref:Calcium uniporter protein n=1 Tax=Menidia menidia TaxID=238744 RepID=A0A8S4BE68_9TELE|nr:unnamed protein product [Menidia menidia]
MKMKVLLYDWMELVESSLMIHHRQPVFGSCQALFYSTASPSSGKVPSLQPPHAAVCPLMSGAALKRAPSPLPMLMSVGDLIADLQREDSGASASVLSRGRTLPAAAAMHQQAAARRGSCQAGLADGERIASTTLIEALLDTGFQLAINDVVYDVSSPEKVTSSSEHARELEDMKHVVHLLHTALHLPEHHLLTERQLLEKIDNLKQELSPLEKVKAQLSKTAEFHSSRVVWTGMALLSVQAGALSWLTWWVYSWDVMEPVTYFITYATSMGVFAYYDYLYPDAKDRQFLRYFYKGASKRNFNVEKYNRLKEELTQVEEDLRRLRYPTQLQLPLEQIQPKP